MPITQPALIKSGQSTLLGKSLKQAKHATTNKQTNKQKAKEKKPRNICQSIHQKQYIKHRYLTKNTINPGSTKATITKNQKPIERRKSTNHWPQRTVEKAKAIDQGTQNSPAKRGKRGQKTKNQKPPSESLKAIRTARLHDTKGVE